MQSAATLPLVREIMLEFAEATGLAPAAALPRRYLWTDAFAVGNFLGLYLQTGEESWRELAIALVRQVHDTLGRHRGDDRRTGWISGLGEEEGALHPTRGGLRIGKKMAERGVGEPSNQRQEWDRDGQYYHYLTKWMQSLGRIARVSGESRYLAWSIDLAQTAHARFVHEPFAGAGKRLYWKMSIDLRRPLVASMGQHDPLDGLVTLHQLREVAGREFPAERFPDLARATADLAEICRESDWVTDDPLGLGGLLTEAWRMVQLMSRRQFPHSALLEEVVEAALPGLRSYLAREPLALPASHRLPFRELGLAIGLKGVERIAGMIGEHPELFESGSNLIRRIEELLQYTPLAAAIEDFWLEKRNSNLHTWRDHRDINMVMLATSLAPDGFLTV